MTTSAVSQNERVATRRAVPTASPSGTGLNPEQSANVAKAGRADLPALIRKSGDRNAKRSGDRNTKNSASSDRSGHLSDLRRCSAGVRSVVGTIPFSAATQANYGSGTGRGGKIKEVPAGPSLLEQLNRDGKRSAELPASRTRSSLRHPRRTDATEILTPARPSGSSNA